MSLVYRVFSAVPYSNKPIVKDVIASLHSYFTVNVLISFAVIISFRQFGGRPLECMLPLGFNGAWEQYAENYCWAQDTYFVPPKEFVENVSEEDRRERRISYYQWMPFFLLFQAACFKAPTLIWKYFAGHSGMKLGEILRLATDPSNSALEIKKANINALCVHLQGALRFHSRLKKKKLVPHKVLCFLNVKYSTYYVAAVYMVAKVAFLINVCYQVHLLSSYLLPEFKHDFGLHAWKQLLWDSDSSNSSWKYSGIFPRVSLCDFEVREMGNLQKHTVQCVLVVNIFTEKVFIMLWTWFVVLTTITAVSVINWSYLLTAECSKAHFLLNHLEMSETPFDKENDENVENVDRFTHKYLGTDGIFVLRMISAHADVVFTTELIASLWRSHHAFEEQRRGLEKMDQLWSPYEQKLEKALVEEAELAASLGVDSQELLNIRRRSIKKGSFSRMAPIAVDSLESLKEFSLSGRGSSPRFSVPTVPSKRTVSVARAFTGKIPRRHSLEELDAIDADKIRKFGDSSSGEDEDDEKKSVRRDGSGSRRNSGIRF